MAQCLDLIQLPELLTLFFNYRLCLVGPSRSNFAKFGKFEPEACYDWKAAQWQVRDPMMPSLLANRLNKSLKPHLALQAAQLARVGCNVARRAMCHARDERNVSCVGMTISVSSYARAKLGAAAAAVDERKLTHYLDQNYLSSSRTY